MQDTQVRAVDALALAEHGIVLPEQNIYYNDEDIVRMIIHVEVSNQQKMHYLIELLKSMDFVERIKVDEEMPVHESTSTTLSSKYWGAWRQNPFIH